MWFLVAWLGLHGQTGEMGLAIVAGAVLLMFAEIDRIEWFKAGGITAKIRRLEEVTGEAYATLAKVRKLATRSTRAVMELIMWSGRFGGGMPQSTKLGIRDGLCDVLKELGVPNDELAETAECFNVGVYWNHLLRIIEAAKNCLDSTEEQNQLVRDTRKLMDLPSLDSHGAWST